MVYSLFIPYTQITKYYAIEKNKFERRRQGMMIDNG